MPRFDLKSFADPDPDPSAFVGMFRPETYATPEGMHARRERERGRLKTQAQRDVPRRPVLRDVTKSYKSSPAMRHHLAKLQDLLAQEVGVLKLSEADVIEIVLAEALKAREHIAEAGEERAP